MKVLAIVNQKGGVGKTTTAVNLGAALARRKNKVLVIDLDPQGCSSVWILGKQANENEGIYQILANKMDINKAILPSAFNFDAIPANMDMSSLELALHTKNQYNREQRLKQALSNISSNYDYIVCDCPPSLGLGAVNALLAAQAIIIPVDCGAESYEAIQPLLNTIRHLETEFNHKPQLCVLPTFVEKTSLAKDIIEALKQEFPGTMLSGIRKNTRLAEAYNARLPIFNYDQSSIGATDYATIAEELDK